MKAIIMMNASSTSSAGFEDDDDILMFCSEDVDDVEDQQPKFSNDQQEPFGSITKHTLKHSAYFSLNQKRFLQQLEEEEKRNREPSQDSSVNAPSFEPDKLDNPPSNNNNNSIQPNPPHTLPFSTIQVSDKINVNDNKRENNNANNDNKNNNNNNGRSESRRLSKSTFAKISYPKSEVTPPRLKIGKIREEPPTPPAPPQHKTDISKQPPKGNILISSIVHLSDLPDEIQNLIISEDMFIKKLLIARDRFLLPCRSKRILSSVEIISLFANFEEVLSVHQNLLKDLESMKYSLSEIFQTKFKQLYAPYVVYCSNLPHIPEFYNKLIAENTSFATLIQSNSKHKLLNILRSPRTRIFHYPKILNDIIRYYSHSVRHPHLHHHHHYYINSLNSYHHYFRKKK